MAKLLGVRYKDKVIEAMTFVNDFDEWVRKMKAMGANRMVQYTGLSHSLIAKAFSGATDFKVYGQWNYDNSTGAVFDGPETFLHTKLPIVKSAMKKSNLVHRL